MDFSRLLTIGLLAAVAGGGCAGAADAPSAPSRPPADADRSGNDDPVRIYRELDGTWRGEFVGWDATGRELYRIDVTQHYETIDATTQRVTVEDRMADGTVIRGEGENTARRRDDGTLQLRCVVRKDNGDVVEHDGREITLPGGRHGLVWSSSQAGRSESFVEWVGDEDGETVYRIQGTGVYDGTTIVMSGRYVLSRPD